ncbi:TIGR01459 family HAD-type hydrolase [Salinarimonas sp.]|jgi:HAD superfamily hydrolase (TIGR01459 family)|uniref:TIGR01459 family HAD-type hydrolase n=1 Tax=Salinarimonas sp. TaxID=2766526 RepID=UPI0032D8E3FD
MSQIGPLPTIDVETAFARYEAIRHRLPQARFPATSRRAATLSEVAEDYDVFVLDAFGVLNVGERPIAGAVARIAELRARGKRLFVLTNGATHRRIHALEKYGKLGFDFTAEEVVSSRDVAAAALQAAPEAFLWAAAAGPEAGFEDLGARVADLEADPALLETADGFLLLSSASWRAADQERLVAALQARPRPVVVANPDLVAPRETGLTLEPGWWAHDLADRAGVAPAFYGKPFQDAYDVIVARCPDVAPARIAMVGDTLHTDVLGGRAAGFGTILVLAHGLFAGRDAEDFVARSGIRPDVLCETT